MTTMFTGLKVTLQRHHLWWRTEYHFKRRLYIRSFTIIQHKLDILAMR